MIFYSDKVREGVITNLFNRGIEVHEIQEATAAVVHVLKGKDAGQWIVVDLDDDTEILPLVKC